MTTDLVSTLEGPGEFDALAKLRPGEPYFALIGRDRLAPQLVLEWAHLNRSRARLDYERGKVEEPAYVYELRKSSQAETVAWAMQAYKAGVPADSPVVDRDETEHYSGFTVDPTTAARDKRRADLTRAASRLYNCIAEMTEAAEIMSNQEMTSAADQIRNFTQFMRGCADAMAPRPITTKENEDV